MGLALRKKDLEDLPTVDEVLQTLAEKRLSHYVKQAWHVVEPKNPFFSGWHIDIICEHLEAVTNGEILKLLINIPPRHMKSLAVAVFWPTWVWGPRNLPAVRWLFSSYAQPLSTRDSVKCRRLITSPWYQQRWGDRFYLVGDQNEKIRFENDKTGNRIATSVGGVGTGEGGDCIICDDPHNVKEGESEAKRLEVLNWWDESMSTRGNDPHTSAKVIVMQRIHENDLSGHVLEEEKGYVHLCLPARYEGENRVKTCIPIDKPFEDPRTEIDEPLWKALYDDVALKVLEKDMSSYAIAGQLQQHPSPRGGGMFQIENFGVATAYNPSDIINGVRYWDKAGTEGGGKRTAGILMFKMRGPQHPWYLIADVVKGHWSAGKREVRIKQTAELDGKEIQVWVEQEPGSGGKESAENTVKNLAGYTTQADKVTGSKELRAEPYAAQVEVGNVRILKRPWSKDFIDEHEHFPTGRFSDQVDAASGAFNKVNLAVKRAGVWGAKRK